MAETKALTTRGEEKALDGATVDSFAAALRGDVLRAGVAATTMHA